MEKNEARALAQANNMAAGEQRTLNDGSVVTVNPCADPNYKGCVYVTLKEPSGAKVTWIVRDGYIIAEK